VPPSLAVEDPGRHFCRRVLWAAPLVSAAALLAALVTAEGLHEVSTVHASLRLCWSILVVAAGAAFVVRWRVTGEAPVGLLGAALVVWALPQLPFALADVAGDPQATWRRLGPMTRMTVMVPAGWLLLRCARSPEVDSSLRPAHEAVGFGVAATAAGGVLVAGQAQGLVAPMSPEAALASQGMLAAVLLTFAGFLVRPTAALPRPVGTRVAAAFAGLAVASAGTGLASLWWPRALWVPDTLAAAAATVLLLLAATMLRSALDFFGVRMLSLRLEADSAGDAVRREEERIHELRATVAGIRQASGALSTHAHRLDPAREQDLQQLMAAELARLERMLSSDWRQVHPGPVMLDELIRPLVAAQREQGLAVRWRPNGCCALAHADAVSEILCALLGNARVHAPGAAVQVDVEELAGSVVVTVHDDGPGLPPEVRRDPFCRGVRGDASPGEGLGLHVARDLAAQNRGSLTVVDDGRPGSAFALTLPAVPDPCALPLHDAGAPYDDA
jgi:signal transduction histidine kinase